MAKMGAPSHFKPEYCEQVIDHMSRGMSFKSFGAVVKCTERTLYDWVAAYPDFAQSKKRGETESARFYEDLGLRMATGQLKVVVKETPMLDIHGKPMYDDKGNLMMEREYQPAKVNATVWIFMMKNMHRWRDNVNVSVSGDGEGGPIRIGREETLEEKMKRLNEANRMLQELEDGTIDITAIQKRVGRGDGASNPDGAGEDQA